MKIGFQIFTIILTVVHGCSNHPKHFLVDEISSGDTLTLMTRYSDCGEWGGHHEQIQIFDSLGLFMKFQADKVDCDILPYPRHEKALTQTKKLENKDKRLVQKYIEDIKQLNEEDMYPCSNASNLYYIIFKGDTTLYIDWCEGVDNFNVLTKKLLR